MSEKNSVQIGFSNNGGVVVKNRAYRRRRRTIAELDGISKKFYTTKHVRKRKNGKQVKIRKKSGK